jgi:hypothetical protein
MGKGLQDSRNPQQTNSGAVFQLFPPRVPPLSRGTRFELVAAGYLYKSHESKPLISIWSGMWNRNNMKQLNLWHRKLKKKRKRPTRCNWPTIHQNKHPGFVDICSQITSNVFKRWEYQLIHQDSFQAPPASPPEIRFLGASSARPS